MNIKDIVNRDVVNLTNCDQEPIHIPGSIQPHGFLLGILAATGIVDYCSANTLEYIGIPHEEILGKSLGSLFGKSQQQLFDDYTANSEMQSISPLKMILAGKPFHCTVHLKDSIYILEAELVREPDTPAASIYAQTSRFLAYMHDTNTLQELCQLVAEGTRDLTGYDRVMVYRFDKDYNGEVFAESRNEDLEPFLGLHYPHTDIPAQARALYLQNLLRLIADINYTPVPIFTIADSDNKTLDLGFSILRSTSPIHVQYLQNMGVGATLTISLIHQKKLWGMITCHHYSAKNLTPEIRLAAQLQGHFLTSQIDVRQSNEEYDVARKANSALAKMNGLHLMPSKSSFSEIIQQPEILELCNASGVSLQFGAEIFKSGITPSDDEIRQISQSLFSQTSQSQLHTDKLIDYLPHCKELCQRISGLIYHSLDSQPGNCVIWYRPETITEVNWAGDPKKAIEKDENGLSPRKSFELWKEFVKFQSKPWLAPEINAAMNYAYSIQRQMILILLTDEGNRNRELNAILKETNSELENINWISTHDLQEPLRKIQLISSRILSKEEEQISVNVTDSLKKMNTSAQRMQALLSDILKYTKIQHTKAPFSFVDTHVLINEVVENLSDMVHECAAKIEIAGLPEIWGIPFLLRQLFSNLVSNSLKYSRPGVETVIKIHADISTGEPFQRPEANYYRFIFSDNGIGFDPQFAETIFNIFMRLHSATEYKGSGVGLALCKKIMQAHKGHIAASGHPGSGAEFTLYFPIATGTIIQ